MPFGHLAPVLCSIDPSLSKYIKIPVTEQSGVNKLEYGEYNSIYIGETSRHIKHDCNENINLLNRFIPENEIIDIFFDCDIVPTSWSYVRVI